MNFLTMPDHHVCLLFDCLYQEYKFPLPVHQKYVTEFKWPLFINEITMVSMQIAFSSINIIIISIYQIVVWAKKRRGDKGLTYLAGVWLIDMYSLLFPIPTFLNSISTFQNQVLFKKPENTSINVGGPPSFKKRLSSLYVGKSTQR